MVSLGAVACGGDDDEDKKSGAAAHVCSEQIACGYQILDQQSCVQLFEGLFSADKIAACDACVSAEPCATEESTCMSACSL